MRRRAAIAMFCASMALAPAARAQYGAWFWVETRVPFTESPAKPRPAWRVWAEARFLQPDGLVQMFFRTGPLVEVSPFLTVAVNGTAVADRTAGDFFRTELRLELEPTYQGRLGEFTWADRNRLEYRWFEGVGGQPPTTQGRYRNQLRVNYAPEGAKWVPFVFDEIFIAPSAGGFNQNRATVGLGHVFDKRTRLDVGVMMLSRKVDDVWDHAVVLATYLYVGR